MKTKNVFFFGAALLGTLLLLDGYLQLAGIQTPMETRIDPRMGPVYIPNKWITHFNEGFFIGASNQYGYMGPAVPPRRTHQEERILLLGDSFVLSHTVLPRHFFGRFLEEKLTWETGREVHALNFGKADFNLRNMYQYYLDFAGTFDHDLALFFVGERDLVPSGQVVSILYPKVELQGDALMIDRSFNNTKTYRFYKTIEPVLTNSGVLRLVFNAFKLASGGRLVGIILGKLAPQPRVYVNSEGSQGSLRSTKLPQLNEAILKELAKDPRNILVVQEDLTPELWDEVRSVGMPIIDLFARLDTLRSKGIDPCYWSVTRMQGHWNHAAQQAIGSYLADQLVSLGMIRPDNKDRNEDPGK